MSSSGSEEASPRSEQLDAVLADYMERVDAGERVDPEAVIKQHPHLEEDLRSYFNAAGKVNALAGDPGVTADFDESVSEVGQGSVVRYFGDYEILSEIARGGMGVVFKARQKNLNRVVALKMILAGEFADESFVRRFYAEAEAAANLQHPNIVAIHEVGAHEGQHYFSMDYIDGTDMSAVVRDSPLAPRRAAEITQVLAEAVQFAHERRTLHRDLKPSNVLLDRQGNPHISDFGLAKRVKGDSGLTATGQVLGTPSYMPPEQALGRTDQIGPLSDVYSLGAILYELVTARPPFRADTSVETLRQVVESEPVSPRQLNSSVPRDLETICLKCLQKEPKRRYFNARQLAEDLRRFVHHEPILARPPGRIGRTARWCRRNPVVAALSLLLAAALIAVPVVATMGYFAAAAERDRTYWNLYVAEMHLAHRALEAGETGQAQALLEKHVPESTARDHRGWEWEYLRSALNRARLEIRGTSLTGQAARFSPDGQRILGATTKTLRVWDASTGRFVCEYSGHQQRVVDGVWGPDGQAASADAATIHLWDALTGVARWVIESPVSIQALAWSRSLNLLAAGDKQSIRIWNPETAKEVRSWDAGGLKITALEFQPENKLLVAIGTEKGRTKIVVWDVEHGRRLHDFRASAAQSVTFSPDHQSIAAVTSGLFDRMRPVRIWNLDSGEERSFPTSTPSDVYAVAWDPRSDEIAVAGGDGVVTLWDSQTGRKVRSIKGHTSYVRGLDYRADGERLASVGLDRTLRIWDPETAAEIVQLRGHRGYVSDVAWSPDGSRLFSFGQNDSAAIIWDTRDGVRIGHFGPRKPMREGDGQRGRPVAPRLHEGIGAAIACSADGRFVATAGWDHKVHIWDPETKAKLITLSGHTDRVRALAWHPTDPLLASSGKDGYVRLWRLPAGTELYALKSAEGPMEYELDDGTRVTVKGRSDFSETLSITWSPEGRRFAAGARNGTVRVWSNEGKEITTLRGHRSFVEAVAWSPSGSILAAVSKDHMTHAGEIILWNVQTWSQLRTLKGHSRAIKTLAWRPVGDRLASGGEDNTIRVWDPGTGRETLTLRGHAGAVPGLDWSPDGRRLASASTDGSVGVWDASTRDAHDWYDRKRPQVKSRFGFEWVSIDRTGMESPRFTAVFAAQRQRWEDAAEAFQRAIELGAIDGELWRRLALAQLAANDETGYRKTCAEVISRFGTTSRPDVAAGVAWLFCLSPNAAADYREALTLARAALQSDPQSAGFCETLGALLYRAGDYGEAVKYLTASADNDALGGSIECRYFLAMSLVKLGRKDARAVLDEATRLAASMQPRGKTFDDAREHLLFLRLLGEEAKRVIDHPTD